MKRTMLLGTLAAVLAAGQAQAGVLPLQGSTITATYNGGEAVLGVDHGFNAEPGSNTAMLDNSLSGTEFISGDYLFGFDFTADGLLAIYANDAIPVGNYRFTFDFGATLAAPIGAFTLANTAGIVGMPVLSVLNDHTIGLDLSSVTWNSDFVPLTTQLALQAPADVPEPASAALLLGALGALAYSRRRR